MAASSIAESLRPDQIVPVVRTLQEIDLFMGDRPWRLVGNAAVNFWASANGTIGDIDIATNKLSDIPPTADNEQFLLSHRHPPNSKGQHYAQLISVLTGFKIDVFTAYKDEEPPIKVPLDKTRVVIPLRDPETQMVALIYWLERRVFDDFGFGPHNKYIGRIRALMNVANPEKVEALWQKFHPDKPGSAYFRYQLALEKAQSQPLARVSMFKHKITAALVRCSLCERGDPDYPIASKPRVIAELLKH